MQAGAADDLRFRAWRTFGRCALIWKELKGDFDEVRKPA